MPKDDIQSILRGPILSDIGSSVGLLSRLPVKVDLDTAKSRGARAAWSYPLAGLAVGLLSGLAGLLALGVGLPPMVAAGIALAIQVVVTGAMHEDGLADSADGLWGGWDRDRRLEIMKDSRIGAYGVLALVVAMILRWAALSALFELGRVMGPILLAAALSRSVLPVMMGRMSQARPSGLSRSVGRPPEITLKVSFGIGVGLALFLGGLAGGVAVVAVVGTTAACMAVANAKIGGQTGDILGATQVLCEIAALCAVLALA